MDLLLSKPVALLLVSLLLCANLDHSTCAPSPSKSSFEDQNLRSGQGAPLNGRLATDPVPMGQSPSGSGSSQMQIMPMYVHPYGFYYAMPVGIVPYYPYSIINLEDPPNSPKGYKKNGASGKEGGSAEVGH